MPERATVQTGARSQQIESCKRWGHHLKWLHKWQETQVDGGVTVGVRLKAFSRTPTLIALEYPDSHNRNFSNRPVRTRMPGGVAGAQSAMTAPYADL